VSGRVLAALTILAATGCNLAVRDGVPYGTVRVQANSRTGVPLPGIEVMLYTGRRPMGYARTDAAGRAVFRQVPPDNYGVSMQLPEIYADLSELTGVPPGTLQDGIVVAPGGDTVVAFTFARRGLSAIEAQLQDSLGGAIAGVQVDFYRSTGVVGTAVSNTAGIARLDSVLTGQYGAALQPPDSLGVPGAPFQFRDGLIVDLDSVPRATFTLATCYGSIAVSARDQADAAIAGIDVTRYRSAGTTRQATTDAGGDVTFLDVPCGEHGVKLEPLAGFTITMVRDSGFVDGLVVTKGAALSATLRATRN
jgi:hypothetical protein